MNLRAPLRDWRGGLFVIALWVLLSACVGRPGLAASLDNEPSSAIGATAVVIDAAISALSRPSPDYRGIMRQAIRSVPAGASRSVAADISMFLERLPQVGADFRCSTDFIVHRARKELVRIENDLLGLRPEPVDPEICYAAPFALDSTRLSETLEIYGYDLDRVGVEMFLVTSSDFRNVTSALTRKTHYHVTLRLGNGGVELDPTSLTLGLAWGHLIHYSIPIVQPSTRLCHTSIEDIAAGTTLDFTPHRLATTGSIALPQPRVWALAALGYESNVVDALVCMSMAGVGGSAAFSGCSVSYVHTTESERVVEGILGASQGQISVVSSGARDTTYRGSTGPIAQWTFSGLVGASGSAAAPAVLLRLGGIRIVTSERDGCVSALTYSEARREGAFSRDTLKRLDRQLERIPSNVRRLHPRFAPTH